MTKKLEEEFNLPPVDQADNSNQSEKNAKELQEFDIEIKDVEQALSVAEKIDHALKNVQGLAEHDVEMDDIGQQAIDSYQQLMSLGMNVSDRDAGSIFDSAAKMLKTALEAKDSKVNSKLKQIDMMIKKARLDANVGSYDSGNSAETKVVDRNELLKIINSKPE